MILSRAIVQDVVLLNIDHGDDSIIQYPHTRFHKNSTLLLSNLNSIQTLLSV